MPDTPAASNALPSAGYGGHRRRINFLLIIVVNLLPVAGVLFFDWDVGALVILYWSENIVIGFYNLLKMATSIGLPAVFTGMFFLIHYGGFCAVHGFFLLSFFMESPSMGDMSWPFFLVFVELLLNVIDQVLAQAPPEWIIAFLALFISHGYSFVSNFLIGGERHSTSLRDLMTAPYKRIVALHIAIIAGGVAVMALGQPLILLLVLVALKILMDLKLHQMEHARQRSA